MYIARQIQRWLGVYIRHAIPLLAENVEEPTAIGTVCQSPNSAFIAASKFPDAAGMLVDV